MCTYALCACITTIRFIIPVLFSIQAKPVCGGVSQAVAHRSFFWMDRQEAYEAACLQLRCFGCDRLGVLPLDKSSWPTLQLCPRCFLGQEAAVASRAELLMAAKFAAYDSTDDEDTEDEEARDAIADDPAGPGGSWQAVQASKDVDLLSQEQFDLAARPCKDEAGMGPGCARPIGQCCFWRCVQNKNNL